MLQHSFKGYLVRFHEFKLIIIVSREKVYYDVHDEEAVDNLVKLEELVVVELTLEGDVKRCYQTSHKQHSK